MILGQVFEPFVAESPVSVMVRRLLEIILEPVKNFIVYVQHLHLKPSS
jgi:hypothetical protein